VEERIPLRNLAARWKASSRVESLWHSWRTPVTVGKEEVDRKILKEKIGIFFPQFFSLGA
jgi:hypothetical protein